jgi:hypothetical protein
MLKMDRSEWWNAPYGSGQAERIFESGPDAFWYASNPEEGASGSRPVSVIEVYQVDEPVNPDEKYNSIDGNDATYFALFMEAFGNDADENFTYLENTNGVIWYEGIYYIYNREQHQYVIDNVKGQFVKLADKRSDPSQFYRYTATEYSAIKIAGMARLVSEGVVRIFSLSDLRTKQQPDSRVVYFDFPDGGWNGNPETDANGTLFKIYGSEATSGRVSIVIPTNNPVGSYDFKVERVDDYKSNVPDADENRYIDSSTWNRLGSRGFVGGNSVFNLQHRHTLMEISFQANEGIQGHVQ